MPPKHNPVYHYECTDCRIYFTTLVAGLAHLRRAPEHIAESHDLLEAHGSEYRFFMARKLAVSYVLTTEEADSHITDLEHRRALHDTPSTLYHKTNHQRNCPREFDPDTNSPDDSPVRKCTSKKRVHHRQSQSVVNNNTTVQAPITVLAPTHMRAPIVVPAPITMLPLITVRVTVFDSPRAEQYCNFAFDRAKHTTIRKLLVAAAAAYREKTGADVDFVALGRIWMMMKLVNQQGQAVGGRVCEDRDLDRMVKVKGEGWFGQLEVG